MTATLLTACGGDKKAETAAPAENTKTEETAPVEETVEETADPAEETVEETTDSAEGTDGMVSDENFEILQDNYAILVECYNAVADAYNSDEIAADAELEEAMNMAADVIEQMGEITQDNLTEEDAEALNGAMEEILDALVEVADGLASEAEASGDAAGEMVSDETFSTLQENYAALTEAYDAVADLYNDDSIEADADIENALNEAYTLIEQMGTIEQSTITEADAEELNSAMMDILEVLDTVVNAMG